MSAWGLSVRTPRFLDIKRFDYNFLEYKRHTEEVQKKCYAVLKKI